MSKININKNNNLDALQNLRQAEVNRANKSKVDSTDNKIKSAEDKLQFSERLSEVGKLVDQIKELPDIRQAKVNELREKIANNEFNPSSDIIAESILREE